MTLKLEYYSYIVGYKIQSLFRLYKFQVLSMFKNMYYQIKIYIYVHFIYWF